VLIGVDRYEDEQGIGSLQYCAADMTLLHRVLTGPNGDFDSDNVLLMTDAAKSVMHKPTYTNLVNMIPRWLAEAQADDDVLIAFSGHGITDGGKCYLLPRDAKRSALRLTSVSVPQIREWLESCRAKRKVLVLDACHAGAGKAVGGMTGEWADELSRGKGFLRLASCDTKQKSNEDPDLGHGVFTYYLAEALEGSGDADCDGRVGADEEYRYVSRQVRRWARSKGLWQDPLMSGRVAAGMLTLSYAPKAAAPGLAAWQRKQAELTRIKAAAEEAKRLAAAKVAFGIAEQYDEAAGVSASRKAAEWQQYVDDFASSDYQVEFARKRLSHWRAYRAPARPTPVPTTTGKPFTNEKDGSEMIYVPAGTFKMGSEDLSDTGSRRVVSGGWSFSAGFCLSANRNGLTPSYCSDDHGFPVVLSARATN